MTADILKIQKTVRKSIKDYAIAGSHEEEALVALISANIYLALEERGTHPPLKPKVRPPLVPPPAAVECRSSQ